MLGGPLYQLYLGARLAKPDLQLLPRRIIGIAVICWLPLLVLSAAAGRLTGGVSDPFLGDPEVHIKLLLAVPLLIAAEVLVHERMRIVVAQFLDRDLIARRDQPRFQQLIAGAMRLRNSVVVEVVLFIVVLALGVWMWKVNLSLTVSSLNVSSWYAVTEAGRPHLTAAGTYYGLVSLTIFRFLMLRWYYRLFIWYWFLWKVRAMPLQFNYYHPDRAGGLGFLSASLIAFSPMFVAQTTALAGAILTRIIYNGERLTVFKDEIAAVLIFFAVVAVLPLTFFAVQLERVRRLSKREFGTLASHYVNDFRNKWIEGDPRPQDDLLGTPDLQSLADLANSFSVANGVRLLPLTKQAFLQMMIIIALPLLPLVLTMIPFSEIIDKLFKLVF